MDKTISNNLVLKLAYLYPTLLNIYGDRGNVLTLLKRCEMRQIKLHVTPINIDDKTDLSNFDIYFIGGGQDQQQTLVSKEIKNIANDLISAIESDAIFLAVCGGYQLLGKYYRTHVGEDIEGINALDLYTVAGDKRMIGNVLCKEVESNYTLVGFENHSGKTYLGNSLQPLAKVIRGFGNNGEDGFEGVRYKNVFGTYLHGSLLPKNPMLTDKLIRLALNRKGLEMPQMEIDNNLEEIAHKKALKLKY